MPIRERLNPRFEAVLLSERQSPGSGFYRRKRPFLAVIRTSWQHFGGLPHTYVVLGWFSQPGWALIDAGHLGHNHRFDAPGKDARLLIPDMFLLGSFGRLFAVRMSITVLCVRRNGISKPGLGWMQSGNVIPCSPSRDEQPMNIFDVLYLPPLGRAATLLSTPLLPFHGAHIHQRSRCALPIAVRMRITLLLHVLDPLFLSPFFVYAYI